ncbi:uncharacterized protein LOC126838111 [Adelges cooleyi]|uniref:uncharacterized protein LOC126838111 n=1 Tax=Adelges cooleyi TaxID=133065 RepID=UPI00217FB0C4|nr:uncharacterized protein LOC126838111 [Adelges cooleyi]
MKTICTFIVGCLVLYLADCRPVEIISQTNGMDNSGQFVSSFRLDDGTGQEKVGELMPNTNGQNAILVQHGSYTTNVEGRLITYNWVADTRGFRISKA